MVYVTLKFHKQVRIENAIGSANIVQIYVYIPGLKTAFEQDQDGSGFILLLVGIDRLVS